MNLPILIILFSYFIQENEEDGIQEMMPFIEKRAALPKVESRDLAEGRLVVFFKAGELGRPVEP